MPRRFALGTGYGRKEVEGKRKKLVLETMEYRIDFQQAARRTARCLLLPTVLIAAAVFALNFSRWDFSFFMQAKTMNFWLWMGLYLLWTVLFVAAVVVGVVVHEGIHGVLIALLVPGGFKQVQWGYDRATMTPFAHARGPLRAWQMAVVCLGPLVMMGLAPFVWAVVYGSIFLYLLSLVFIVAAGGDILYALLLRKVPAGTWVEDLPDAVGFSVAEDRERNPAGR